MGVLTITPPAVVVLCAWFQSLGRVDGRSHLGARCGRGTHRTLFQSLGRVDGRSHLDTARLLCEKDCCFNPSGGLMGVLTATPLFGLRKQGGFNPSGGLMGVLTIEFFLIAPSFIPFQSLGRVDGRSH